MLLSKIMDTQKKQTPSKLRRFPCWAKVTLAIFITLLIVFGYLLYARLQLHQDRLKADEYYKTHQP